MASILLAVILLIISLLNGYHCIVCSDRANPNTSSKIKNVLLLRILISGGLFILATHLV